MPEIKVAHVTTIDATLRFLLLRQLQAIQREGYAVAAVSSPGPWTKELEREGIVHHAVTSLSRGRDPLADLKALAELTRLFRRERFTIVHTHMPKTGVLGRLAAGLAGVPIVVNTIHGPYGIDADRGLRRWFFLTLERVAAAASDFELCQSREIFDLFTRVRIFHPARSAHLGNGIDLTYFDPAAVRPADVARLRRELRIPEGAPVVGTVGRLTWDKGYGEVIAAVARVHAAHPDAVVIAAGQPEERDALPPGVIRQAEAQGMRFLGFRFDIREIYALMDVFVLASYHEGFPRAAMEAAAMGKALVLTDIRGCREVVTPGRNGLLVPVRKVEPLAEAILRLVQDRELRRRFGEESRERAVEEFDERRVFERVLGVYRDLLRGREGVTSHGLGAESAARR